jgi:high-affinity Fe2+/Pb2+ permease
MPKSKGRQKQRNRRYQLAPQQKKRTKKSPRWYGWVVLITLGIGVTVIVLNYMGLMPGETSNMWLWIGLGLVAAGFVGATFWK